METITRSWFCESLRWSFIWQKKVWNWFREETLFASGVNFEGKKALFSLSFQWEIYVKCSNNTFTSQIEKKKLLHNQEIFVSVVRSLFSRKYYYNNRVTQYIKKRFIGIWMRFSRMTLSGLLPWYGLNDAWLLCCLLNTVFLFFPPLNARRSTHHTFMSMNYLWVFAVKK